MDLSFQEKSIWVSVVTIVVVFAYYFASLFGAPEVMTPIETVVRFIGAVAILVIIEIVLHVLIAVMDVKGAEAHGEVDERDRLVVNKASRNAYFVLCISVFALIGHFIASEMMNYAGPDVTPIMSANLLLLAIVLAEIVNFSSQLFYYRRGI